MNERGQTHFEFLITVGAMFLLISKLMLIITEERFDVERAVRANDASTLCSALSERMNEVYLAGEGARVSLTLPVHLQGGGDYNVTLHSGGGAVRVASYGTFVTRTLIAPARPSETLRAGDEVEIININGSLSVGRI